VIEVHGQTATVDFFGIRRETRLDVVDEPVGPGDYILNHVGFAIRKIPAHEIGETLALYELLLREAEKDGDLMAADVRGEIVAGSGAEAPARRSADRPEGRERSVLEDTSRQRRAPTSVGDGRPDA